MMRDEYAEGYRALHERHWWWRARESLLRSLLTGLSLREGQESILDVGCGDGLAFPMLSRFGSVEGVEPLAPVSAEHEARIWRGPFEAFAPGKQYSLILMLDVLEHLADPGAGLRHALSLLQRDGTVVITVPAFMGLWTHHDDVNEHVVRFTRESFAAVAHESGFQIRDCRYAFHWTYPVKRVQHFVERWTSARPDAARIPAAPINLALLALSRAEQHLLGPLRLPFGSSLVVVGSRQVSAQ